MRLTQSPRELSSSVSRIRCAELARLWLNPIMSNGATQSKGAAQQAEQYLSSSKTRPDRTVKDAMIVLELRILPLAHETQGLGNNAFARRENGANKQDLHVLEHRLGEQRRACYHQGYELAGHAQPPPTFLGGNRQELTCPACAF